MKLSKQKALQSSGLVRDPRFLRLHSDPRFQRSFKRKLKIPIDSRFSHIFSDTRFSDPLSLDKRGRKVRQRSGTKQRKNALQEYYDCEDREGGAADGEISRCDDDGLSSVEVSAERDSTKKSSFSSKKTKKEDRNSEKESKENGSRCARKLDEDNVFPICTMESDEDHLISLEEDRLRDATSGIPFDQKMSKADNRQYSGSDSDAGESEESLLGDMSEELSESSAEGLSSSSEYDSAEEVDSSSDEAEEEKVPTTLTETRRLALVNMDWDHIKAVDILAVMNSFLPKGGQILSVIVYPSEFGLQQMKEEEKRGPQIFSETEEDGDEQVEDQEIINERLRQYEITKLRYYYAIVECDSSDTAGFLYKACDGMEFERSSNTLDLRFVPDDMEFKNDPRDCAKEVPADYQAPTFETHALQHSKVKLTWDDDETDRIKKLRQKFNADQLNEMDFKAYLASDASSDESDKEEGDGNSPRSDKISARDKYRALLLGSSNISADDSDHDKNINKVNDKHNDKDMEITFNSGLEDLSKRLLEKNKNKNDNETVWEAYLRKRKEKRKAQKQEKHDDDDEASADDGEVPFFGQDHTNFDDPFFKSGDEEDFQDKKLEPYSERELNAIPTIGKKGSKQKAKLKEKKLEEEKSRAELELLLTDEHGNSHGVKGYNLKKKLKDKRKGKDNISEKLPTVNYDDPRFSAVFTSHHFAIDPTEPEYKRSAANLRNLLQKQQKHQTQAQEIIGENGTNDRDVKSLAQKKEKQELSLLVKSLKRKVGTAAK